jgi:ketosteroid isomerase-like protein
VVLSLDLVMGQDPKAPRKPSDTRQAVPASQPSGGGASDDLAAVRAVANSFVAAYRAKDAKALGALFTEGAEIVDDDGEAARGRPAIVERFTRLFEENEAGTLEIAVESVRLLSADTAIEEG